MLLIASLPCRQLPWPGTETRWMGVSNSPHFYKLDTLEETSGQSPLVTLMWSVNGELFVYGSIPSRERSAAGLAGMERVLFGTLVGRPAGGPICHAVICFYSTVSARSVSARGLT